MAWLDDLLKQTEESEAPERYFWWSGLAAISAITRKNVWVNRHYYKLYPNIYVALISSRSGARKGIPISICKKILEEVNQTRIISGCNSVQGLIQELGSQKTLDGGAVISDAHGIMLSDEFDAFLTEDPKALTYLTTLYNTHEHEKGWEKTLKNSPKVHLKAPCLTMLVASNEMLFDSVVKQKDIEGGFIGRTVLVRETKARRVNSLVEAPKNRINFGKLSERLLDIAKIKGEFIWSTTGGEYFDSWYKKLCAQDVDDRTGSLNRLGDQVLKVTMLISLSKRDDLVLEAEDIQLAIHKCLECIQTAIRISPVNAPTNGSRPNAMRLVEKYLKEAPNYTIERSVLVSRLHPYNVHSSEINVQIVQLAENGWIRAFKDASGKMTYQLTDEGLKNLLGGNLAN